MRPIRSWDKPPHVPAPTRRKPGTHMTCSDESFNLSNSIRHMDKDDNQEKWKRKLGEIRQSIKGNERSLLTSE